MVTALSTKTKGIDIEKTLWYIENAKWLSKELLPYDKWYRVIGFNQRIHGWLTKNLPRFGERFIIIDIWTGIRYDAYMNIKQFQISSLRVLYDKYSSIKVGDTIGVAINPENNKEILVDFKYKDDAAIKLINDEISRRNEIKKDQNNLNDKKVVERPVTKQKESVLEISQLIEGIKSEFRLQIEDLKNTIISINKNHTDELKIANDIKKLGQVIEEYKKLKEEAESAQQEADRRKKSANMAIQKFMSIQNNEYKKLIGDKVPVLTGYMVGVQAIFPDKTIAEDVAGMIKDINIETYVIKVNIKRSIEKEI